MFMGKSNQKMRPVFPSYPELVDKRELLHGRSLVVAPHPDDEVAGCGGMILAHRDAGNPLKVIYVTDGSRGGKKDSFDPAYVAGRVKEAEEACAVLGVEDFEFLGFPDQGLVEGGELRERAKRAVEVFQPDRIYLPSPFEIHRDHLVVSREFTRVLRENGFRGSLVFYEVSEALRPNILVDITQEMDRKEEALLCYLSQLEANNYLPKMKGLNRYRTVNIDIPQVLYVEAYWEWKGAPIPPLEPVLAPLLKLVEEGRKKAR